MNSAPSAPPYRPIHEWDREHVLSVVAAVIAADDAWALCGHTEQVGRILAEVAELDHDLDRANVELGNLRQQVASLRGLYDRARAELNAARSAVETTAQLNDHVHCHGPISIEVTHDAIVVDICDLDELLEERARPQQIRIETKARPHTFRRPRWRR